MDKALFRKDFLENMAPTWHRRSKRRWCGARIRQAVREADKRKKDSSSLPKPNHGKVTDLDLVVSFPRQKPECFFRDMFDCFNMAWD